MTYKCYPCRNESRELNMVVSTTMLLGTYILPGGTGCSQGRSGATPPLVHVAHVVQVGRECSRFQVFYVVPSCSRFQVVQVVRPGLALPVQADHFGVKRLQRARRPPHWTPCALPARPSDAAQLHLQPGQLDRLPPASWSSSSCCSPPGSSRSCPPWRWRRWRTPVMVDLIGGAPGAGKLELLLFINCKLDDSTRVRDNL